MKSRQAFEQRDFEERYYVLRLAAWISDVNAECKLRTAIQKRLLPQIQVLRDQKHEDLVALVNLVRFPNLKQGSK